MPHNNKFENSLFVRANPVNSKVRLVACRYSEQWFLLSLFIDSWF